MIPAGRGTKDAEATSRWTRRKRSSIASSATGSEPRDSSTDERLRWDAIVQDLTKGFSAIPLPYSGADVSFKGLRAAMDAASEIAKVKTEKARVEALVKGIHEQIIDVGLRGRSKPRFILVSHRTMFDLHRSSSIAFATGSETLFGVPIKIATWMPDGIAVVTDTYDDLVSEWMRSPDPTWGEWDLTWGEWDLSSLAVSSGESVTLALGDSFTYSTGTTTTAPIMAGKAGTLYFGPPKEAPKESETPTAPDPTTIFGQAMIRAQEAKAQDSR